MADRRREEASEEDEMMDLLPEEEDDPRFFRDEAGFGFADPGGRSALRAASKSNPRNQPCPTCGRKNVLTPRDVQLHYQCDHCADVAEGLIPDADY